MKRRWYTSQEIRGELACRSLSQKAEMLYLTTDPITVYEYDTDDGVRYAYNGCLGEEDNLTFDELQQTFEDMFDDIHNDEEEWSV